MFLHFKTGMVTFIQFISLSLFGIANCIESIVTTCNKHGDSCLSNSISSVVFFMLTVLWFGCVWITGYLAQEWRSRWLALCLIAVELAISVVALFQAKHHQTTLNLTTSLVDLTLAFWVIVVAIKQVLSKGGRVVASERSRRRRNHPTSL